MYFAAMLIIAEGLPPPESPEHGNDLTHSLTDSFPYLSPNFCPHFQRQSLPAREVSTLQDRQHTVKGSKAISLVADQNTITGTAIASFTTRRKVTNGEAASFHRGAGSDEFQHQCQ